MTEPVKLFWCRVCRKKVPVGGKCKSCLTQLTPWFEPKRPNPPCPKCKGKHSDATEWGSRLCSDCGTEFEDCSKD